MVLFLYPVSWSFRNKSDVILIDRRFTYNATDGLSIVMRFFNNVNLTINVSILSVNKFCEFYDTDTQDWSWAGCSVSMNNSFYFSSFQRTVIELNIIWKAVLTLLVLTSLHRMHGKPFKY